MNNGKQSNETLKVHCLLHSRLTQVEKEEREHIFFYIFYKDTKGNDLG